MSSHTFIFLVIISPWPIFYSILLYYASIYDKSFNFFISNKTQILKYFSVLGVLLIIVIYIFLFRLWGNSRSLNIHQFVETLGNYLHLLTVSDVILLVLFFLFILMFWIFAIRWFYIYIKRRVLALYLYFSQFQKVNDFLSWLTDLSWDYTHYLTKRVNIFTKNETIWKIARFIWPNAIGQINKILFRFLLPYLVLFDILVNHGIITKFFMVLPWFYVYSLFKGSWILFNKIDKAENVYISIDMYGYGTRYKTILDKRKAIRAQQAVNTNK